ncbi:MAG TPA: 3-isopropylmalate dehydratase small subunit [Dehalococcoidia bacterium]|mgnify:FL=1|jgi:3-isopropylmalate/(R)-2-methylmalate dehydratase small subunit|nr:3-isopropylmalate dehydratase small subunit [Chloroflexota bacterium]MQG82193.1 3-isopropylmalate dehydratase small subunit [SAR202 cluster bacterium]HBD83115.1 3-isopropylmalate dehydratase small subunit [Dehalococcoidia bacterium]HBJ30298.1 3-isopropylmalate dehydratase small subunit [Dehalococcoidia bacterium]HCH09326.1 3-isopropylmalate dehydratase small subunit [Dehalococcoidia bacterium]
MEPFVRVHGGVVPMNRVNVDTDQIIPKQFLKRVERDGFGQFLFNDWRYNADGSDNPEFILNKPGYEGADILVAGRNFGCGSSREHAPWALGDYGFRCVIAPSFADIFNGNCFQNGILPVILPEETVQQIIEKAEKDPGYKLHVDLEAQRVWDDSEEVVATFDLEPFRRYSLLNGLDDIGLTMEREDDISKFESQRGIHGGVVTG